MPTTVDYSEIPYLNEILKYLPIDAIDKEDISAYIRNVTNLIAINYKYEQYQFAYFGVHLLYMTYIYCCVWKISKISEERYKDAVVFAQPYRNRTLDFYNIESIFQYSLVPEKELPKIFRIIELDNSQIRNIAILVDVRNDMAHASGNFEILTEDNFYLKANAMYSSIKNIHNSMDKQIRKWFQNILLKYCRGEFSDYSNIEDIIFEQMIQNFYFSTNELLVCNEMSVRNLNCSDDDDIKKVNMFKQKLKSYCEDRGYI